MPTAIPALDEYHDNALSLRMHWGPPQLIRNHAAVDLGAFGSHYREIFAGSEGAIALMKSYRTGKIVGWSLWVLGLATLVTELALLVADENLFVDSTQSIRPLYWELLIPGAVVGLAGGITMGASQSYLSDAVERYNEDLYQRLKGNRAPTASLSFRHTF